jgi:hypothetical protein
MRHVFQSAKIYTLVMPEFLRCHVAMIFDNLAHCKEPKQKSGISMRANK